MHAWGIPAINTLLLLSSGVTVTWAHWALKRNDRSNLIFGLFLTILLGIIFLTLQAYEYSHAYSELNLKLTSGVFGSTFFMLTGFHGFHVTLGVTMLIVILFRCVAGHFKPDHHFGFEAVSWYWHFVDVVWLLLFIFVYWVFACPAGTDPLEAALGYPAEVIRSDQDHEYQERERDADGERDHHAVAAALVLVEEVQAREEAREDREDQDEYQDSHREIFLRAGARDHGGHGRVRRAYPLAGALADGPRRREARAPGALRGAHA
jgi:hypothetical protein